MLRFFFFSSRRRHTRYWRDWSSDVCSSDLVQAVAKLAERRSLPAWVSLDPWMGCGIGTCLGCVVRTQKAGEAKPKYRCGCTDGPVFDAADVVWWGETESRAARGAAS